MIIFIEFTILTRKVLMMKMKPIVVINFIKIFLGEIISRSNDRNIFAIGSSHFSIMRQYYSEIKNLSDADYKVFSQTGEDGIIDQQEMNLVKVALANSARPASNQASTHDSKSGYGLLDALEWSNQVSLELGIE